MNIKLKILLVVFLFPVILLSCLWTRTPGRPDTHVLFIKHSHTDAFFPPDNFIHSYTIIHSHL